MPNRTDVAQGDYEGAAGTLLSGVWIYDPEVIKPMGVALEQLGKSRMMSGGEQALIWFARQIFNGEIQAHLADLDQDNRRLLVEVLAGFAGVEL